LHTKTNFKSVYIAYDPYPNYKGSGTHIDQVIDVLSQTHPPLLLLTLKGTQKPIASDKIHQLVFEHEETNFLKRAEAFSQWVHGILQQQYNLTIGHFRDIWGGLPVLQFPHISPVFEVNGFPSIELRYRYSIAPQEALDKIRKLEDYCLQQAETIITPSDTNQQHIVQRGILPEKISVIPNGADVPKFSKKPLFLPKNYIAYIGALQPWQGIDVLLKAMTYLKDKKQLKLLICTSYKPKKVRPFKKLITKLGITEQVVWKHQLSKNKLNKIIQHALCTVAPLTECSRNLEQGCSPLKVFESMACGCPVVASDLPVVREIITPGEEGMFFQPGRPADLARCLRILMDYPDYRKEMGEKARQKIEDKYSWAHIRQQYKNEYEQMFLQPF